MTLNTATYSAKGERERKREREREREREIRQKEKAKERERVLRDRELNCITGDTNTCTYVPRTIIDNKFVTLNAATYSHIPA